MLALEQGALSQSQKMRVGLYGRKGRGEKAEKEEGRGESRATRSTRRCSWFQTKCSCGKACRETSGSVIYFDKDCRGVTWTHDVVDCVERLDEQVLDLTLAPGSGVGRRGVADRWPVAASKDPTRCQRENERGAKKESEGGEREGRGRTVRGRRRTAGRTPCGSPRSRT